MNYRKMGKYISRILFMEAIFMVPALLISIADHQIEVAKSFLLSMGIILLVVIFLHTFCKKARPNFYAREGMVCVGLSWIFLSIMGCLPFYLSGEIPNFVDALFETVSGFTTTGASILKEVELMSRGLLYWRSFTHWVGGMGVLVFMLALVPKKERGEGVTMHIMRAESPGPDVGKLVPHIKETAKILYIMYILLTIVNFVFLIIGKMPVFDSVCTAFGTAGTGGFGIKNDSIAGYSPYLQNVCTVFMMLFGVNFSCYYLITLKQIKRIFCDEELRLYIGIILGSIALIAWNIRGIYSTVEETIRHAAFQVVSIITTTGFATTDFDLWPSFSKAIILCLMMCGACAGSTGGGIKCGRLLLLVKGLRRNVLQALSPNRVQIIRTNGRVVSEGVLQGVNIYLSAYVLIIVVSFIIISLDGLSVTTNISAVLSCFNNIGPGLEAVGPASNYSAYSILSKIVLIINMLAGRLEIFPILILGSRSVWKRK